MASAKVTGITDVELQLNKLCDRSMIKKIVMAGADAAIVEYKRQIQQAHHVRTGEMLESVGPGKYKESLGGGEVSVYPQGYDHKGVANAVKAYVINYGRGKPDGKRKRSHKRKMGDKFITKNQSKIEAVTLAAMAAEQDRLIAEITK